jgi:hypothetical protein
MRPLPIALLILLAAAGARAQSCAPASGGAGDPNGFLNSIIFPSGTADRAPAASKQDLTEANKKDEIRFIREDLKATDQELQRYTEIVGEFLKAVEGFQSKPNGKALLATNRKILNQKMAALFGPERFGKYREYRHRVHPGFE